MSRSSNDDRRTMPPLPAAGVWPLAHQEPSDPENDGQNPPQDPPQTDPGSTASREISSAGVNDPTSNPLNLAMLELQGDSPLPDPPPLSTEPAPPVVPPAALPERTPSRGPESPEASLAPPPPAGAAPASADAPRAAQPAQEPPRQAARVLDPSPRGTAPTAGPPAAAGPGPASQAAESRPPLATILVGGTIVWFLFGILGAWAYDQVIRKPNEDAEPTASPLIIGPNDGTLSGLTESELDPLKTRLGELGKQVDEFEKQLGETTPPAKKATDDLAPIQQRLDDVARSIAAIDPLSKRLQTVNARMEGLETSVQGLKGELASLQANSRESEKGKPLELEAAMPPSSVPTSTPAPTSAVEKAEVASRGPAESAEPEKAKDQKMEVVSLPPAAQAAGADTAEPVKNAPDEPPLAGPASADAADGFAEGLTLFKNQKYQEAYKLFEKLETTTPDDARVWYFAALSHGFTEDDFTETGKTATLLKKGLEREKAGTPKTAEIDAALQDLDPAHGKTWLNFKRKMGLK